LNKALLDIRTTWLVERSMKKIDSKTTFQSYHRFIAVRPLALDRVKYLNKLIMDYNLVTPSMHLQKFGISLDELLQDLEESENEIAGEGKGEECVQQQQPQHQM